MQSKNAIGNLKNRYKAVLKKCALINVFGSLAVATALLLSPIMAENASALTISASIGGDGGSVRVENGQDGISVGGATAGGRGGNRGNEGSSGNGFQGDSVSGGGTGGNGGAGDEGGGQGGGGGGGAASVTVTNASNGGFAISKGGNGGHSASGDDGRGGSAGSATASHNTNTANTGTAYGGIAISEGGNGGASADNATAESNTVTITSGTVDKAFGGIAISQGGGGGTATAKSNSITINGGTVSNNIIGGMMLGNASSRAENNTVTLSNAPNLANSNIWGGAVVNTYDLNTSDTSNITFSVAPELLSNSFTFNGNTLNVNKYIGSGRIASIGNFENYNFVLPASTAADSTALSVTDLYLGNDSVAATETASIGTVSIEAGHNLPLNSTVILIDSTNAINGTIANNGATVTSDATTFTQQEWEINQDNINHDITATFISETLAPAPNPNPNPNPNPGSSTRSLAEIVANSHTGTSTAILGSAANTVVGVGIPAAQMATNNASNEAGEIVGSLENQGMSAGSASSHLRSSWAPFAVVHGGYNSFDSGVATDVTSLSFVGGLAHTSYFNASELLIGAFIETGTGSYNTSAGSVDSDGNLNYFGGGLFARYEWYTSKGLPYIEASARLGNLNTDFDSDDIIDTTTGSGVNYETNSMYYGMHIGAGYVWNINTEWAVDFSAKYFWTHQESIDKEIAGDNFDFDAIDSHIVRVGATVNYEMLNNTRYSFAPYVGLHYEHEFDSEARASVENISIANSASLEGGTTVLSLGATFAHINGFSLNAKVEGSLGERDGVSGMVEVSYTF